MRCHGLRKPMTWVPIKDSDRTSSQRFSGPYGPASRNSSRSLTAGESRPIDHPRRCSQVDRRLSSNRAESLRSDRRAYCWVPRSDHVRRGDLRIVGGALHGPIARTPGILGRDQPVVVEVGIVGRLADIVTERGVAVLDHVVRERVVGRVAALAHRPNVEELELVLCRARDRLDVLDLGVRILEVETVPDAQVDAVVDVDLIRLRSPTRRSRRASRPQCGPGSAPQVRPWLAGRRLACVQVSAGEAPTSTSAPAINQPAGIRQKASGPAVHGGGVQPAGASGPAVHGGGVQPAIESRRTVGWRRCGVGRRPVGVDAAVRRRPHSLLRPRLRLGSEAAVWVAPEASAAQGDGRIHLGVSEREGLAV